MSALRSFSDYRLLEDLLQLDEETIYSLTIHRFALRFQQLEASYSPDPRDIRRPLIAPDIYRAFSLRSSGVQICPQCLGEVEYGILYWRVNYVIFCPRHAMMLLNHCPVCGRLIPQLRLVPTLCPECLNGDYRAASMPLIKKESFLYGCQMLLLGYLGVEVGEWQSISAELLASPLSQLLPWQYFRLLDLFEHIVRNVLRWQLDLFARGDLRVLLQEVPSVNSGYPDPRGIVITLFHYIFVSWPENFFLFLDTLYHKLTDVYQDFEGTCNELFCDGLQSDAFLFIRQAYEEYRQCWVRAGRVVMRERLVAAGFVLE